MKHLILTAIFCGMLGGVYARQSKTDTTKTTTIAIDSTTKKTKKTKSKTIITIGLNTENDETIIPDTVMKAHMNINTPRNYVRQHRDSLNRAKHNGFSFGLALFPLDLGLALPLDNGSFNLSAQNKFLSYSTFKTTNDAFNIIRFGYRFNNNFRITLGAGVEWTLIRLQNDSISIVGDKASLSYKNDGIHYSKNRFSSEYLTIPLTFDYRSTYDKNGNRLHLSIAPQVGFLIDGMLKQISSEHGKTKNYNDFHFAKFQYGATLRIGYGDFGIFTKYYFNDMFVNSPAQSGLKSFSIGLSYGW
jgi:hypothetical protein